MIFRKFTILVLLTLFTAAAVSAQNDSKIAEQKRVVEALEKKIAAEEQEIAKLKRGRSDTEERVRRLARQIDDRTQLMTETEAEAGLIGEEISRRDSLVGSLSTSLDRSREQYAEMVREAYRNYRQQNFLTYLFSARDFADMARRVASLREMAAVRQRRMAEIRELTLKVEIEREELGEKRRSLDSVAKKLTSQRERLERDARNARTSIRELSEKERNALARKASQEQQLEVAISELRKLTKGNKSGASFSEKTTGLHLPVEGGRVKRYKENMAEVSGAKGAGVISIYEGKVVDVRRNRITNKYEVYVAHGEYITSYANMGSACVEKGQQVKKNQRIGTIGSEVNMTTMETEYKLVFGIYPPAAGTKMSAENCFRKQ